MIPASYLSQLRTFEFKNSTGGAIPPFACMIITGATDENGELVLSVRQPNATDATDQDWSQVAFNTGMSVPDGNNGRCCLSYPALAVVDGTITAGDAIGPVDGSWYLADTGSAFKAVVGDATNAYSDGTKQSWLVQPNPPGTFDVQVKGDKSALQKSHDSGNNWTDWATIGAC